MIVSGPGNNGIEHNLFIISMGGCIIATDEALVDKFGKFSKSLLEGNINNLVAIRALVFQIRNAFAHRPTAPEWRFNDPIYERVYRIVGSDLDLTVDLRNLNHKKSSG